MVKRLFYRFYSNPFFKNVSTLAFGTLSSQLILFAVSPILTRLFSASNFGILALFTSISTIAAILTTGRYEFAVGLPEKDEKAVNVVGLITLLSSIASSFYLIVIIVFKNTSLSSLVHNEFMHLPVAYLIPLFTFSAANFSALQYWNQRSKAYKRIAFSNTLQVTGATICNIVFGLIGIKEFGLIYSLLIGQVLAMVPVFLTIYKSGLLKKIRFKEFKPMAKEYINFPKYMLISDFSLATSQQIVPIIFSILFNSATVGFFSLANRMLKVPSIVLTSSIGNVFRNDAIDVIRATGNCRQLYRSTFKKLIFLSLPIYGFLAIFSPQLFSILFGKNWVQSGYFARIICISTIFDFLSLPLNSLFYVLQKQKMYMRIQFLNALSGIIFIYIGHWLFGSAYYSILLFAINNAIFSLLNLYITYNFSKHDYNI
jgi:teichuronic acid exporter